MKLISFFLNENSSYGIIEGERIYDLGQLLGSQFPDLISVINTLDTLDLKKKIKYIRSTININDVIILPVIPNPNKIICVGMNYLQKQSEFKKPSLKYPTLFARFPDTQVGHNQPLVKPKISDEFDYEGELAFIIGKGGRNIPQKDAMSYVAGYSCYLDGSVRDWQKHSVTAGKNFIGTGGFGPWMVTSDEIPDPHNLTLMTRLNGKEMQNAKTDLLIFKIPQIIEYISKFTPLSPGDVIATGSPAGVGSKRKPAVFMKRGDVIEVEISSIGILSHPIIED